MTTTVNSGMNRLGKVFLWLFGGVGCIMIFLVVVPGLVGGSYSVLGVPFYNLVCLTQSKSFGAALLGEPPSADDYNLFLMNEGCNLDDADRRSKLDTPPDSDGYVGPSNFWSNDVVSNLFHNIGVIMEKHFVEGTVETSRVVVPSLQRSVLAKVAYYIGYSA